MCVFLIIFWSQFFFFFLCGQVGAILVIASISSEDTDQFGDPDQSLSRRISFRKVSAYSYFTPPPLVLRFLSPSPHGLTLKMRPKILNFIAILVSVLRPHLICFTEFLSALTKKKSYHLIKMMTPCRKTFHNKFPDKVCSAAVAIVEQNLQIESGQMRRS